MQWRLLLWSMCWTCLHTLSILRNIQSSSHVFSCLIHVPLCKPGLVPLVPVGWNRTKLFDTTNNYSEHWPVYPFLNGLLVIAIRTRSPPRKDCLGSLGTGILCMSLRRLSSSSVITSDGDICIVRCLLLLYDKTRSSRVSTYRVFLV